MNKSPPPSPVKINEMLLEIRELLDHPQLHSFSPHSQKIQSFIQQSTKIVQNSRNNKSKTLLVHGKILAAAQLLKDQKSIVKNYVKQKIQSQLFQSAFDGKNMQSNSIYLQRIEEEKQLIIDNKRKKIEKQQQKRQQIIQNVNQFQTDSRVKISLHQIDSMIFKQEPQSSYLLNLTPSNARKIASRSNQVKNSNLYLSEVYSIQEYEKQQIPTGQGNEQEKNNKFRDRYKKYPQSQFLQFVDEPQQYEKFSEFDTGNKSAYHLNKVLNKYPHLVKIFWKFLENQIKINSLDTAMSTITRILSQQSIKIQQKQKQSQEYVWKNVKKKGASGKNNQIANKLNSPSISKISQKFGFKAFVLNEQNKVIFQKQKISERRISKMIGQSKNFHPKKCILTRNQLIYFQQNQKQGSKDYFPQDAKTIQLQIQPLIVSSFTKQEGSIFSKKQIPIEMITLKGKNRLWKFERQCLDGRQLYNDLQILIANKIYANCCRLTGQNRLPLYKVINDKEEHIDKWQMGNQMNGLSEAYSGDNNKEMREISLKVLLQLTESRKNITQLCLNQSSLLPSEISECLRSFKRFQNLKIIHIRNMSLAKQSFQQICQLVNQSAFSQFYLSLTNTKLDDQCVSSNVGIFTTLCSKVSHLDLSNNFFGVKTLTILKQCMQSISAQIRILKINNCPTRDLNKLGLLIKESRKLEIIEAQNNQFGIDGKGDDDFEKSMQFLKSVKRSIKNIDLSRNGVLSKNKYKILQKIWNTETIQILKIDLHQQILNDQTQKDLLRTDHNSIMKNYLMLTILSEKKYINSDQKEQPLRLKMH